MYRDLLDTAIGTAPPSTVDLETVIARQRRLTALRGSSVVGSVAAIVAVLSVAALAFGGPGRALPAAGPRATSAQPPTGRPSLLRPAPTEAPSAAEARLHVAIHDAVLAVAPGATIRDLDGAPTFRLTPSGTGGTAESPGAVPALGYTGTASVTLNGATGSLFVMVTRAGTYREACMPGAPCVPVTGSRGETGFLTQYPVDAGDHRQEQYRLWLDRGAVDACLVLVIVNVEEPDGVPPLDADQMTRIAGNPAITLYP